MRNEEFSQFIRGYMLGRSISGADENTIISEVRPLQEKFFQGRLQKLCDDGTFDELIAEVRGG